MRFIILFFIIYLLFNNIHTLFNNKNLKFSRNVFSGLGDRFSILLCLAAFANVTNTDIYTYWYEGIPHNNNRHRFYSLSTIKKYVKFPKKLHILSKKEFDNITFNMEDIDSSYSSILDYNVCLYTDGFKMFKEKYNINKETFISSYKKIISDFDINIDTGIIIEYIVVHLRGEDKIDNIKNYKTIKIIKNISLPLIFISNDNNLKSKITKYVSNIYLQKNITKKSSTYKSLYDFKLMLNSNGIVQHSPKSWSAFSSVAAMLRNIPLINTYKYPTNLFKNNIPYELFNLKDIISFYNLVY
jgi:hypothetical protein